MKLVSLLPVLLLIGAIEAKTNFKVNGTFYCDYDAWCFFVTLWEEDTTEYWNDVIDTMGTKCVFGRHSYYYELDGTEYEDGPFDDYYEIFLTVRHNCTSYGKRELRRETKFESVNTPVSYTTWNVKLDGDRGVLKDEYV